MKSKVLIVDHEILINKLLESRLTKEGFKVEKALDGISAVKKAATKKYDVILADIMVPNIAGLELIAELKKSRFNSETPIMVLTALSSDELVVDVLGAGVKDYIVKPFSLNVVVAKLKQFVSSDLSAA